MVHKIHSVRGGLIDETTQLSNACSHCGVQSVAFEESEGTHFRIAEPPEHSYAYALMTCQHCFHTSMFVYRFVVPQGDYHEIIDDVYLQISHHDVDLGAPQVHPASVDAPDHLPDKAKQHYAEAVKSMGVSLSGAGMLFRKALEASLPGDGKLVNKIAKATKNGDLTPAMGEWAHRIRVVGNAAAHEIDDLTLEEIQELRDFARLFLMYLFTLPEMLASAKRRNPGR